MPNKRKQSELLNLQENANKEFEQLSCGEGEVLTQLLRGDSNKAIAISLNMSVNTVEKYLSNIYKKLGVASRTEAILWWMKNSTDFRT